MVRAITTLTRKTLNNNIRLTAITTAFISEFIVFVKRIFSGTARVL
jgi:hypothetical protein